MLKQWLSMILLAVSFSVTATESSDAALNEVLQRYVHAVQQFDQSTLEQVLAADYIEVSPVGEVDERRKVIGVYDAKAKAAQPDHIPAITLSEVITRVYGQPGAEVAVSIAKLQFDVKGPDGAIRSRAMRVTFVSKKIDKRWQISSSQFTSIKSNNTK